MARKRRKLRSSGKQGILGLLLLLLGAMAVGALIGSCAGKRQGAVHVATGPVQTAPRTQPDESRPAETSRGDRPESTRQQDPAPQQSKPEDGPSAPATAPGETASAQAVPDPAPQAPARKVRRYGGMQGETAYVRNAGDRVALTFDAGASAAPTPALLDTLRAHGLRVTFFLTGKWCEQNPELTRRIAAEGHEIGNHTYSHPDLRKLSESQIVSQLEKTDAIVTDLTGRPCAAFFRPPYGGRDKRVLETAAKAGYSSIYWSLDSWDAFRKGITSAEIRGRVMERVQPGDVVLLHCGSKPTADALPSLISELGQRGYEIVSVSELIAAGH